VGLVTAAQQRAAGLLARGLSQREVGRVVGRSERTIRAWLREVDGFREAAQPGQAVPGEPTAEETLRDALRATGKDGGPDWSIRVQAARVLFKAQPKPEEAAAEHTFVQVVIQPDGTVVDAAGVVESSEREPDRDADPQPVTAS
jgi:hypothetical protein